MRLMAKPLLERQVSLIAHLTSSVAIFGGAGGSVPDLDGIDPALLRVEARFSYAKRMEKITAVLPRTFELLGSSRDTHVRAFVETCPPTTLSRLENACQFHRYLRSCWTRQAPDPPYIGDVAAFEIAWAKVDADPEHHSSDPATRADHVPGGSIRRCPHVILLRCAYDIRPIFEASLPAAPPGSAGVSPALERATGIGVAVIGSAGGTPALPGGDGPVPVERDTPLVVALPPGADGPQVFEVIPALFDLLSVLNDWTDPQGLDDDLDFAKLVADLAARGLVEVRR
jgi:hypothetical protein